MSTVFPFRPGEVDAILDYLKKRNIRDFTWFFLGCNTALRVSDLLNLKIGDVVSVRNDKWRIRPQIYLKEKKTGKRRIIYLNNPSVEYRLRQYIKTLEPLDMEEPLFPSRKHNGREYPALSRKQAWYIVQLACMAADIDTFGKGTHSMRKTFVRRCLDGGYSVDLIQHLLGHSSASITLAYAGFTEDDIKKMYKEISVGIKNRGKRNTQY